MRTALIAALALAALAAPAFAVTDQEIEAQYSKAYTQCLAVPSGQSTVGMIDCTREELARQDAILNRTYAAVMKDLNARQIAKLRTAQRAWLAYRDADCASMEDEDWGTLSRVIANGCVLRRTVERTLELKDYPPGT